MKEDSQQNVANAVQDAELSAAPNEDLSTEEGAQRARILRRLIKARAMLQESRNRSAELQCALERFKYRQAKISNG
jgi:hypothetical protein